MLVIKTIRNFISSVFYTHVLTGWPSLNLGSSFLSQVSLIFNSKSLHILQHKLINQRTKPVNQANSSWFWAFPRLLKVMFELKCNETQENLAQKTAHCVC